MLRNLEKQIRWSFEPITDNWCYPRDPLTGGGCQFWLEPGKPPERSVCAACPVHHVFCAGCLARRSCFIARQPKTRPDVSRFLTRFNVARQLHQPLWTTNYKELPIKEWAMIRRALGVVNECELESAKKFKRNNG